MSSHAITPRSKQVAEVAMATTIVAGFPVAVVWWLRESGTVTSVALAIGLGMVISLLLSYVGRVIWETRPGSEDLLFSELMVWGYVHRLLSQRRLANVPELLAPIGDVGTQPKSKEHRRNVKLLEQLVSGMETRDPYLHGHSRRVARHSWMIARQMALPREEVARIRTAAAIHDVGKINTPTSILHKPDRLTDAEFEVIKRHPGEGAEMAEVLDDAVITAIVRHHHERVDGSGYPDRLTGEDIPLGARIVAVADTFDAITSSRSYRSASPHKKAIAILKEEAGTRLDADVVKAFCSYYAGRGPLALWSFLAALPERLVSWLGSGAAGVASAAKVAAVAALVGGTAAATSGVAAHQPARFHRQATLVASVSPTRRTATFTRTSSSHRPGAVRHHEAARTVPTIPARRVAAQSTPVTKGASPGTTQQTAVTQDGTATGASAPISAPKESGPEPPAGEAPAPVAVSEPTGKAAPPKPKIEKTPAEIKREELKVKAEEEAKAKEVAKLKREEEVKAKEEARTKKEAETKLRREEEAKAKEEAKLKREEARREKPAAGEK